MIFGHTPQNAYKKTEVCVEWMLENIFFSKRI